MIDRQLLDYAVQKISEGPVYLVNYDSLYADIFNLTAEGDIFRLDLPPEPSNP